MILPDKHLSTERSLVSLGAVVLGELRQPRSVSALWESVRQTPGIGTFHQFTLAVTFLFTIGAVSFVDDLLLRKPL
jgi:hypothetical protein